MGESQGRMGGSKGNRGLQRKEGPLDEVILSPSQVQPVPALPLGPQLSCQRQ